MTVHLVINERMCLRFVGVRRVIELTLVFTVHLSASSAHVTRRRCSCNAERRTAFFYAGIYKFRREYARRRRTSTYFPGIIEDASATPRINHRACARVHYNFDINARTIARNGEIWRERIVAYILRVDDVGGARTSRDASTFTARVLRDRVTKYT